MLKVSKSPILVSERVQECVIVFAVVVAAHILLRGSAYFLVGAFNDDGAYTMLGKSLAAGTGYHLTYLVGSPVAVKFPPALPALLAIPWALGGTLAAVRTTVDILNPIVSGLAAAMVWLIGRRDLRLERGTLAVVAVGPFLLDQAIQYYSIPLAEPYFLLGWATAVALAATVTAVPEAVALGLVLAVATLFRSAGAVLIPGCLAALALRRVQWRAIGVAAVAALTPLVAWAAVHGRMVAEGPLSSSPDEVSYLTWIPSGSQKLAAYLVHVPWNNGRAYFSELSGAFAAPVIVGHLLVVVLLVAAILGAVWSWRQAPAVSLTVAPGLAVIFLWPFAQDRLLLPLLPFAGLLAAQAIQKSGARLHGRLRLATPLGLAAVTLIVGQRQVQLRRIAAESFVQGRSPEPRDASVFFLLAGNSRYIAGLSEWIRTNTAVQDRLLVDAPAGTYLYSGRVTAPASPAEPDYAPSVFRYPGRYLTDRILQDSITVIASGARGPLSRDIEVLSRACPGVLSRLIPNADVYRVTRDERCLRSITP